MMVTRASQIRKEKGLCGLSDREAEEQDLKSCRPDDGRRLRQKALNQTFFFLRGQQNTAISS